MEPVVNYDHKTIQMRRGTTAEWRRYGAICIPAEGEICVEFFQESSGQRNGLVGLKVGNGEASYTSLPYLISNQTMDDRISDEQIQNWDLTVEKLANLTASEIDQKNAELGDNVQEALDDLHSRLLAIDPDGGSIEINDIGGLEDALNNKADKDHTHDEYLTDAPNDGNQYVRQSQAWEEVTIPDGGSSAWDDITGKPSEYPPEAHTHEQSEIDGLEDRLTSIEGSISSGGGFVDAPNDGQLYGRQSEAWAEVVIPDTSWDSITGKPSDFPPAAHNHDGVYQPVGDYLTDAPNDGAQYVRQSQAWAEVTIPEAGAAVQIGATFDGTPKEGDQWLETPAGGEAVMWVYDGEKWLQMPGGGGAGQDGITTATLPLANPTREATGLSTQSDANNYFAEAIAKVVNEDGDVALTDYYTKTESDAAYQPKGDYIDDAPNDGEEYARKNQSWVKLQDHNYTGADAVKLTGDQSVAGHKTWTSVATFGDTVTMRGTLNGDDTANFQNAVTAGSFVKSGGTSSELLCADGSVADSSEYALASKFVICTQAEYDGLTPSADTVYFIT